MFEHVYLAAAALAGITTFFRPLHIQWQLCHPPLSRGPAHLEVSSVTAQGWWVRVASKSIAAAGQQSKGVTRVRASGMLIPTAGLLLLRQASMDVVVSPSRAHATTAAARRARAGRVHRYLCADLCVTLSVCVCTTSVYVFASQPRAPQGRLKSPKFKSGLYTKFRDHSFSC